MFLEAPIVTLFPPSFTHCVCFISHLSHWDNLGSKTPCNFPCLFLWSFFYCSSCLKYFRFGYSVIVFSAVLYIVVFGLLQMTRGHPLRDGWSGSNDTASKKTSKVYFWHDFQLWALWSGNMMMRGIARVCGE